MLTLNYSFDEKNGLLESFCCYDVDFDGWICFGSGSRSRARPPHASLKRSPSLVALPPQAVPTPRTFPAQIPSTAAPSASSPLSSPPAPHTVSCFATGANPPSITQAPIDAALTSPPNVAALNRVALVGYADVAFHHCDFAILNSLIYLYSLHKHQRWWFKVLFHFIEIFHIRYYSYFDDSDEEIICFNSFLYLYSWEKLVMFYS